MIQTIRCMLGMHTWDRALNISQVPDAGMYCVHCMYVDWLVDEMWINDVNGNFLGYADVHTLVPCECYVNGYLHYMYCDWEHHSREERTWDWYIDKEIGTWDEYAREYPIRDADMCEHDRRRARVEYALIA